MSKHFIITNREIVTSPKDRQHYWPVNTDEFIRTDGREIATESLRFGTYTFKNEKDEGKIEIFSESDLGKMNSTMDDARLPSNKFFKEVYRDIKDKPVQQGEILVFIHGFKSDLSVALETVRKLHTKYVENKASPIQKIVLFTWPAMSQIFKYRNDARDARASGYAFARAIEKVQKFLKDYVLNEGDCKQRIHLMAHSMGNRVLEAMIEEIKDDSHTNLYNLFSDTLLVAADVDYDSFENPRALNYLIDYTERIHIFYHNGDKALGISESTKNSFNRLGRWGAKHSRLLPDGVYQYNVSDVEDDDGIINEVVHHWYYYNSDEVVDMICNILSDSKSD